jgi:zinc/manganese transport system permease protein
VTLIALFPSVPMTSVLPPFSPNLWQDLQDILRYDFMRSAFLAGTAVALVAGLVGYLVVLRQLTFASDALSHLAFTGALGAVVLGVPLLAGVFGLTIVVALGMGALGQRARARDTAVGTLLAWVLGVGVLFLSIYTAHGSASNGAVAVNVLFGSIFGVRPSQAALAAAIAVGASLVLLATARPLLFATLDPEVAAARGVPVRLLGFLFLALLAAAVAEAVQVVGALLLFALLVTPAAIAERLVARPYVALFVSALLALIFTWLGLTIAFYTAYPVSFLISALAFAAYILVVVAHRTQRGVIARLSQRRALGTISVERR